MLAATVAGVVFLFGLVNGQNPPDCDETAVLSGIHFLSHERYCEAFYLCSSSIRFPAMMCGTGTLFHSGLGNCVSPDSANCSNWDCSERQTYPSVCCDRYYRCAGSGYELVQCENGETYSMSVGGCVLNSGCVNHKLCPQGGTVGTVPFTCNKEPAPNGDDCSFLEKQQDHPDLVRACAAGASYNQSTCSCTTLNDNCVPNPDWYSIKDYSETCEVSMRLHFNDMTKVTATSEKLQSTNNVLPFEFQRIGVTISPGNNEAVFGNDPAFGTSYLYSYYFNSNRLASPLAITATFKVEPQTGNQLPFNLLQNNFNNVCDNKETLKVSVRYIGGTYTVSVNVTGATDLSMNSQNLNTGTTQASITTNGFVQLKLFFNGIVSGQLIDRGVNGNTNGNPIPIPETGNLGAYIATNKCGFEIGEGFRGRLKEFTVYEGCGDFSNVQ